MKIVQMLSFSGLYFRALRLNTEIYGVNLRIQLKYGKMQTRKNSVWTIFLRATAFEYPPIFSAVYWETSQ